MTDKSDFKTGSNNNDDLDLLRLFTILWNGRKIIIISVIVFIFLGFVIALFSPKEYTASTTMVPQLGESQAQFRSWTNLAAIAGFNFDMGTNSEISPSLYPYIVSSIPYRMELMNDSINLDGFDLPVNIFEYFTEIKKPGIFGTIKKYTIGLPGIILKCFS